MKYVKKIKEGQSVSDFISIQQHFKGNKMWPDSQWGGPSFYGFVKIKGLLIYNDFFHSVTSPDRSTLLSVICTLVNNKMCLVHKNSSYTILQLFRFQNLHNTCFQPRLLDRQIQVESSWDFPVAARTETCSLSSLCKVTQWALRMQTFGPVCLNLVTESLISATFFNLQAWHLPPECQDFSSGSDDIRRLPSSQPVHRSMRWLFIR